MRPRPSPSSWRETGRDHRIAGEEKAAERELEIGDRFSITSPDGTQFDLVVRGIYEPPALGSLLVLSVFERPASWGCRARSG
jgi:hypothetical protein